ncbi:DUF3231 family protein [Neobacillus sp. PS3-34]|uniref:DUF3231 family protein n=1 Tax=Neobacillus sp. PS3-34 TaxID=3070678 RepID=UPI0027E1FB97|nr:DUF3231 family protein [Neobacillus sp. PS3-34]WML47181.1 DUF3231 family protein [Neobacillus sp. PS3-34]
MDDKTKILLTSAEMATLWVQYMNDTAANCVLSYFIEKADDSEVKSIIEFAHDSSKKNIVNLQEIFKKEGFPIPIGFTKSDVNISAARLFSDSYVLMYLRNMSVLGMAASGIALGLVTRDDIAAFQKQVLKSAVILQDLAKGLMLKQGTYIRPPFISTPDKAVYIEGQHFLAGFLGEIRPLTAIEIT